jgi:hypothetical protein
VIAQDMRAQVDSVLATLDPRERYIVRCYYGLDGEEPLTLEQAQALIEPTGALYRGIFRQDAALAGRLQEQLSRRHGSPWRWWA